MCSIGLSLCRLAFSPSLEWWALRVRLSFFLPYFWGRLLPLVRDGGGEGGLCTLTVTLGWWFVATPLVIASTLAIRCRARLPPQHGRRPTHVSIGNGERFGCSARTGHVGPPELQAAALDSHLGRNLPLAEHHARVFLCSCWGTHDGASFNHTSATLKVAATNPMRTPQRDAPRAGTLTARALRCPDYGIYKGGRTHYPRAPVPRLWYI